MTTTDRARTALPIPSIVHTLNPLVRRLLRIGLPMGPNALLTVRGRTSGQPRTFPITPLEANGRRYVFAAFGDVNWVHNLRAAGTGTLQRGRRREAVTAIELTPDEAAAILKIGLEAALKLKLVGSMIGSWYGVTAGSTPADYLESARIHTCFELRPQAAASAA